MSVKLNKSKQDKKKKNKKVKQDTDRTTTEESASVSKPSTSKTVEPSSRESQPGCSGVSVSTTPTSKDISIKKEKLKAKKTKKRPSAHQTGKINVINISKSEDTSVSRKRKRSVEDDDGSDTNVNVESTDPEPNEFDESLKEVTGKIKKKKKSKQLKIDATNPTTENNTEPPIDTTETQDVPVEQEREDKLKDAVTVFVGNLPSNTKRKQLRKLFDPFGKVLSIRFRTNNGQRFYRSQQKTGTPHLIAFISFDKFESAEASLSLNGTTFKDNVLRVNLQKAARSMDDKDPKRTIFVGNLSYAVTDKLLHESFSCCGEIEYARTIQCEKGCKGVGYVCFKSPASIILALEMRGISVCNRIINIEKYAMKKLGAGANREQNEKNRIGKLTGSARRLEIKKQMITKKNPVKNIGSERSKKPFKKSIKSKEFRGVKVDKKRNPKSNFIKKKKSFKGMKLLAKKIAPRNPIGEK